MAHTDERLREIYNIYQKHGEDKACEILNFKHATLDRRLREYRARFKNREGQQKYDFVREEKDGNLELSLKSSDIRTIDELLAYAEIDTKIWEVWKSSVNKWGSETNENYQVKCWLKRKTEKIDIDEVCDYIIERIQKYSPLNIIKRKQKGDFLYEIALVDTHLAQLSWAPEVGCDYDIKIAERDYHEAVDSLIESSKPYKIDRILYHIGQDFFAFDTINNTTTAGTAQDIDSRFQKTFEKGVIIHVDTINKLKKIADIDVVSIQGNHDVMSMYYAGVVLKSWFKNDKNVNIDNSPMTRKYYLYGENLLGFAHASKGLKEQKLASLMPLEAKEYWSKAKNYEIHCGHLHSASLKIFIDEKYGIRVRHLPTLAPLDAWSYSMGYMQNRETQAFLWHKSLGNLVQINHRI